MIARRAVLGAAVSAPAVMLPGRAVASGSKWVGPQGIGSAGLVALTFDDGPSWMTTQVLDILKRYNVKATFFLQGSHVVEHPDIVRRMADEGHVIGNHSWSHPDFLTISDAQAREEIVRTNEAIHGITGQAPVLFRYPYGHESAAGNAVIRELGMWGGVLWHWTAPLPGDFECPGARGVFNFVKDNAVDQALILLHDGNEVTECRPNQLRYLGNSIEYLRRRGFGLGVVEIAYAPSPVNEYSWVKVVSPSDVRTTPGTD